MFSYTERAHTHYPICHSGTGACPPEDCGGWEGYEEFCAFMIGACVAEIARYRSGLRRVARARAGYSNSGGNWEDRQSAFKWAFAQ